MRHGKLYCNGSLRSEFVERTETLAERMRGLLGRDRLAGDRAMLIEHCGAVHTLGMRFALGLVFLDRSWRVTRLLSDVQPWRLFAWGGWRSVSVIEVSAGADLLQGVKVGDCFAWES
ncbi:MAG: DUF192 domain-containing protein [Kiritimatiellae bacterium]|nr:DUF192 domain-containing protein [Kiritimatiellia bacterium]